MVQSARQRNGKADENGEYILDTLVLHELVAVAGTLEGEGGETGEKNAKGKRNIT